MLKLIKSSNKRIVKNHNSVLTQLENFALNFNNLKKLKKSTYLTINMLKKFNIF